MSFHDFKLFGNKLSETDDEHISPQCRMLHAQRNVQSQKFEHYSDEEKLNLFESYCISEYMAHLWWNYKKRPAFSLQVAYNDALRLYF